MATSSRKGSRIFFNSKEATAGTADTYAFFEGRSITADFPTANYLQEADAGKLGAGEHGTKAENQSIFCPVSFKAQRLSEVAFFMSYFLGRADVIETVVSGAYKHWLRAPLVSSRTLPTTSFQYGNTVAAMDAFNHLIINDFDITLAAGGNGVIDATFNGFCNLHRVVAGVLTRNATVNNSSFSGTSLAAEPLINFKACSFWTGSMEATPLVQSNVTMTATDLGSTTDITQYVNSIHITGSNGLSGEELCRAGGSGILNCQERGDNAITLELGLRKSTDYDALTLAGTQTALEVQFYGPVIGATEYSYAMNLFFPVIQFKSVKQDNASPISETISCDVFQDSQGDAFEAFFQNAIVGGMNATLT